MAEDIDNKTDDQQQEKKQQDQQQEVQQESQQQMKKKRKKKQKKERQQLLETKQQQEEKEEHKSDKQQNEELQEQQQQQQKGKKNQKKEDQEQIETAKQHQEEKEGQKSEKQQEEEPQGQQQQQGKKKQKKKQKNKEVQDLQQEHQQEWEQRSEEQQQDSGQKLQQSQQAQQQEEEEQFFYKLPPPLGFPSSDCYSKILIDFPSRENYIKEITEFFGFFPFLENKILFSGATYKRKIVLVPCGYPRETFTTEDVTDILGSIIRYESYLLGDLRPKFKEILEEKGSLVFICSDDYTKDWLIETLPRLERRSCLQIRINRSFPSSLVMLEVTCCYPDSQSPDLFMKYLKRQWPEDFVWEKVYSWRNLFLVAVEVDIVAFTKGKKFSWQMADYYFVRGVVLGALRVVSPCDWVFKTVL